MVTKINSLKVMNDSAERGIALRTKHNTTVSKEEEDVQTVLQVVSVHRKNGTKEENADFTAILLIVR
jgi:hypothetical protein